MASLPLTQLSLASLKRCLREFYPEVASSHLTEALATALGFRTHASLRATLTEHTADPIIQLIDNSQFIARLNTLGYPISDDGIDNFESLGVKCSDLISTDPVSGYGIEYKSTRAKAWRNLMVLMINEGIRQKYFSLRPFDNRWSGVKPKSSHLRDPDYIFDFLLPNGKPAKGYIEDAGAGELAISAVVNPKANLINYSYPIGFDAGNACATGWLERLEGAWLRSSPVLFNCRRKLMHELVQLNVQPLGYGDRG